MNTGNIIDEASAVAKQTITALNSVPVLLALVILQFFILGSVLYLGVMRETNVHQRFMSMIEKCTMPQRGDLGFLLGPAPEKPVPLPPPRPQEPPP